MAGQRIARSGLLFDLRTQCGVVVAEGFDQGNGVRPIQCVLDLVEREPELSQRDDVLQAR